MSSKSAVRMNILLLKTFLMHLIYWSDEGNGADVTGLLKKR